MRTIHKAAIVNKFDKIRISGNEYITLKKIKKISYDWRNNENVQIIFIDAFHFLPYKNEVDYQLKHYKILKTLEKMAFNLDIPVVISMSLPEETGILTGRKNLGTLGVIESFADTMMILKNPKNYSDKSFECHLKLMKNNNGMLDTMRLQMLLFSQKCYEIE